MRPVSVGDVDRLTKSLVKPFISSQAEFTLVKETRRETGAAVINVGGSSLNKQGLYYHVEQIICRDSFFPQSVRLKY